MARPGGTAARGYDWQHQQERARWAPVVANGRAWCAKCGGWIQPNTPWDLGHTEDRQGWTGPEHRRCNRSHGGRNGARVTNMIKRREAAARRSMWTRW